MTPPDVRSVENARLTYSQSRSYWMEIENEALRSLYGKQRRKPKKKNGMSKLRRVESDSTVYNHEKQMVKRGKVQVTKYKNKCLCKDCQFKLNRGMRQINIHDLATKLSKEKIKRVKISREDATPAGQARSVNINWSPPHTNYVAISNLNPPEPDDVLVKQIEEQLSIRSFLLNKLAEKEENNRHAEICFQSPLSSVDCCNTDDVRKLRQELCQMKQAYQDQNECCSTIERLIQRLENKHGIQPPPLGKRPQMQPEPVQDTQPPSEETEPEDKPLSYVQSYLNPDISFQEPVDPFADHRQQQEMQKLEELTQKLHVDPESEQCQQLESELHKFDDQIEKKDKVIQCLELNLLKLHRQGDLIARNFHEIESRYSKLMDEYEKLQSELERRQVKFNEMLSYGPEPQDFDEAVQDLMLKLETDLVNSEASMKTQNDIDMEMKELAKDLEQQQAERIKLIQGRNVVMSKLCSLGQNLVGRKYKTPKSTKGKSTIRQAFGL